MSDKKAPVKKNISSIQVLKTLRVLMQGDYTMEELIEELNKNEPFPVFNNSVISKYINTCRSCGINILNIDHRYIVTKVPFGISINQQEYELINELQNKAKELMSTRFNNNFGQFLRKLSKFSNRQIIKVEAKTPDFPKALFNKAVENKNRIRILMKTKQVIDCTPSEIIENNGKCYFSVITDNKKRDININRVTSIEILNERYEKHNPIGTTVLFKLKGGLAKRYQPRDWETTMSETLPDTLIVSNRSEDKTSLFLRLLRYQDLCEIQHPTSYRSDMKKLIDDMLANYGE